MVRAEEGGILKALLGFAKECGSFMLFWINLSTKLTSFVLRKDHDLGKKKGEKKECIKNN